MSLPTVIQRLPAIQWIRDLSGATSSTAYPTSASAGVRVEDLPVTTSRLMLGPRIHVLVDYFISTGTASVTVSAYGYASSGSAVLTTTPKWVWIATLNGAASITASTSKWSPDASTIRYAEAISVSGQQYDRFATRVVVAGSNDLVTTHIGFEVG